VKPAVRVLATLTAIIAVFGLATLLGGRSHSQNSLQVYKLQLRAQGELLTFAELATNRPALTTTSQWALATAARNLTGAGLSPSSLDARKFIGPGIARVGWKEEVQSWGEPAWATTNASWRGFAARVIANSNLLWEIRTALRDPDPDAGPSSGVFGNRRVDFVAFRMAAQWLAAVSLSELRTGKLEESLASLEALIAMARLNKDEYTLVAQMIRVAIANLGCSITWELLQAPVWTEPQLQRLQQDWENVDLLQAIETGFLGERACGQEVFYDARTWSPRQFWRAINTTTPPASQPTRLTLDELVGSYVIIPAYKLTSINQDELLHLSVLENSLEALRRFRTNGDWPELEREITNAFDQVNRINSPIQRFRYTISSIALPNFKRAVQTAVRAETDRRLTVAAIALARYELRHGQPPSSLQALVPEVLTNAPIDPMSGHTLGYRAQTNGRFVLYSVGEDGRDDGGDPSGVSTNEFGLWNGRDAVWPSAASSTKANH
jgi:type II secretory pathway pseudopilin PulG